MPYAPGSTHGPSIKDNEIWAYLGGLIDGEGTIGAVVRANRSNRAWVGIRLAIGMVDEPLIRWLGETFGGSVTCRKTKNPRHRDCWVWVVSQQKGAAILREALPFLRLKRPQAELCIQLAEDLIYSRWNPVTAEVIERRMTKLVELHRLNRRGAA